MNENQNKTINSSVDHDQPEEKLSNLDRIDDNLADVIENFDLDEEQKESLLQISQEIHSGPIPSARQMKEYYDIDPNIVDEIFELTKNEMETISILRKQESKREDERLRLAGRDNKMGAWFAFIILFTTIALGTLLIYIDKDIPGYIISGTGLVSAVKLFIFPTRYSKEENQEDKN